MSIIGQTEDGKRRWVFAQSVKGRFQKLHRISGWILMAILLGTPWINIGGQPVLRMDLAGRRLFVVGATFTPHDAIFIVLILLSLAFGLFFFTSLYGRMWCGYACPQTVFLEELIRPIEKLIQGDRSARKQLASKRWSGEWWRKQLAVWAIYLALAVGLSLSLMGFFVDPRLLWTGGASTAAYGLTTFFAGTLFLDFAWFREQFCIYLCPYARFQGALTDDHSLNVMYRVSVSEPRATSRQRKAEPEVQHGACIDCKKCVVVCPTGIDIRDGFQLECIGCARCVDACTEVMLKVDNQPSLVQYSSVAAQQGQPSKKLRPRTFAYGGLLTALSAAFFILLAGRHPIEANLNRMPGTLYTVDADGWVRNTFFLQVTNNSGAEGPVPVQVDLRGLEGAELVMPSLELSSTESTRIPVVVRMPPSNDADRTRSFELELSTDFDRVTVGGTFKSGTSEVN